MNDEKKPEDEEGRKGFKQNWPQWVLGTAMWAYSTYIYEKTNMASATMDERIWIASHFIFAVLLFTGREGIAMIKALAELIKAMLSRGKQ